jgi:hypothetical protein
MLCPGDVTTLSNSASELDALTPSIRSYRVPVIPQAGLRDQSNKRLADAASIQYRQLFKSASAGADFSMCSRIIGTYMVL